MSTHDTDQEIRTRIDAFLTELSQLVRRAALESVHEVLGEGDGARRRGPGRPRTIAVSRRGRPRKFAARGLRGKRSSAQVDATASRVLTHVKSQPGQRLEEIGAALKTQTKVLKLPIAKLMAARKLKTKGQKRGTKYFVR